VRRVDLELLGHAILVDIEHVWMGKVIPWVVERRWVQMRNIDKLCLLRSLKFTQVSLIHIWLQGLKVPYRISPPANLPGAVCLPIIQAWGIFMVAKVTRYT